MTLFETKLKLYKDRHFDIVSECLDQNCTLKNVHTDCPRFDPSDLGFDLTRPSFNLDQDFIDTHILTQLHEDWVISGLSRVYTCSFLRFELMTQFLPRHNPDFILAYILLR